MIQKIYEVDPLTCPKCNGAMRILAFIEDQDVIRKIFLISRDTRCSVLWPQR